MSLHPTDPLRKFEVILDCDAETGKILKEGLTGVWLDLAEAVISLLQRNEIVDAVSIFTETKRQDILLTYIKAVNRLDRMRYL